jgi:hypothetical protein
VSTAEIRLPQPTSAATALGVAAKSHVATRRNLAATSLPGVRATTTFSSSRADTFRTARAAASATAIAPAAASGWAWVTAADRAACTATPVKIRSEEGAQRRDPHRRSVAPGPLATELGRGHRRPRLILPDRGQHLVHTRAVVAVRVRAA